MGGCRGCLPDTSWAAGVINTPFLKGALHGAIVHPLQPSDTLSVDSWKSSSRILVGLSSWGKYRRERLGKSWSPGCCSSWDPNPAPHLLSLVSLLCLPRPQLPPPLPRGFTWRGTCGSQMLARCCACSFVMGGTLCSVCLYCAGHVLITNTSLTWWVPSGAHVSSQCSYGPATAYFSVSLRWWNCVTFRGVTLVQFPIVYVLAEVWV